MSTERMRQISRALAVSERARERSLDSQTEAAAAAEAALPQRAVPSRPQDIVAMLEATLVRPDHVDERDWRKAREVLLQKAGPALKKISSGERELDSDDTAVMEAVIVGDGTRPSFLLCYGEVNPNDPYIGNWGGNVATAEMTKTARVANAVGRVQPANGHAANFIGTGWLIDREAGLILTNYHVIEQARQDGIAMTQVDNRLRVDGHLEIDFIGESCRLDTNRFRIVEVLVPPGAGSVFSGFDIVVARLGRGVDGGELPAAVPRLSADPSYANGASNSLAVIGFPAAPAALDGARIDWNFVIRTLFGNKFGVKRLAPGRFTLPLGSHPEDAAARRAIGHDATTFGGASGAAMAAWLDTDTPCFAIHFGGLTESSNYALSLAVARDVLTPLGVVFAP